jgi:two-component system, sensor histidine kinase RegB
VWQIAAPGNPTEIETMQGVDAHAAGGRGRPPEPPWYLRATPLAARPWLVRQRWATVAVDAAVLAATATFSHRDFPLGHLAPFIAASAVGNAAVAVSLTQGRPVAPAPLIGLLLLDVALLTGVLELTGGPFNPFALIYGVYVALAAVPLGPPAALLVGAAAAIGYGALAYRHVQDGLASHHRLNDFPTHLYAMWMAVTSLAELAAYVVGRASAAVEALRERAARADRVAALTTLAAGAAHELSTPLATIAIAARELELATGRGASSAALADDARLIRTEVDRCRAILDQMSGRAGGIAEDRPERLDAGRAVAGTIGELPPDAAARIRFEPPADALAIDVSRAGLRHAVLSLLNNALDASPPGEAIVVSTDRIPDPSGVRITVRDRGRGMDPAVLARAGEPFFTTKEAGRGMGLGLFLARIFAERHGGVLSLASDGGTVVSIDLPAAGR